MQVGKNTVVTIDYTLRNDGGQVLDSSQGREPLVYLHGVGGLIPGLERQLEGKATGDSVKATVAAKDAYGERDEKMVQAVPRAAFANVAKIEKGMQFQARGPEGAVMVTVVDVTDQEVTVDGNHPLAGQTLHFDVDVRDVRTASADEVAHGHAHGPGGHHH